MIRRIYDLVKVQGLTLEGARKALTSRKGEVSERGKAAALAAIAAQHSKVEAQKAEVAERAEAVAKLKRIRQKLLEARATLQE